MTRHHVTIPDVVRRSFQPQVVHAFRSFCPPLEITLVGITPSSSLSFKALTAILYHPSASELI